MATRASLARDPARAVGVYAGVMYGEYQLLAAQAQAAGGGPVEGSSPYWSVANRVSYHLDLHGPSLTVDSACSSSLTAIHLACQALASGECSVAIAGGVNLNLHPLKYVGLSQGRFASSDGHCHSFAAGGDGYVPGEGVGAVILKPLAAALADGDYVHAVIRGWAANHGGKTNGYTVPNPKSQGAVIAAALRRGGVAPESVSYIEAHGTGTELGDPIEIAGLASAFGDGVAQPAPRPRSRPISAISKQPPASQASRASLQQQRMLTPTRRHDRPINLTSILPPRRSVRRSALSRGRRPARCAPGSACSGWRRQRPSAVEEFRPERLAAGGEEPALLIVSARTESQLKAYAGRPAGYLRQTPFRLVDVRRTLQVGRGDGGTPCPWPSIRRRPRMPSMLSLKAAHQPIAKVLDEEAAVPVAPVTRGWASCARLDGRRGDRVAGACCRAPSCRCRRIRSRRRYWIDMPRQRAAGVALHPFLDRAEPSLDGARFVKRFDPAMPVVRDHKVQGRSFPRRRSSRWSARPWPRRAAGSPCCATWCGRRRWSSRRAALP